MRTRRKLLVGLMTLALTLTSFGMVGNMSTVRAVEDDGIPMYRMYNPNSGEHLHTKNEGERNWLIGTGWNYEGVSFIVANEGQPVYRLYNRYSGEHHYTMDANEKSWLLTLDGWNDEGIGWYSKKTGDACEVSVYRLFNPHTDVAVSSHHYTTDTNEKNWLVSIGWNYEGTSWMSMHNVITEDSVAATCAKEGYSGKAVCKTCSKEYIGSVLPIDKRNHDKEFVEDVGNAKEPDCASAGYTGDQICTNCGTVIKGTVIPRAHQHIVFVPEQTTVVHRGTDNWGQQCIVFRCDICGEETWRTGDVQNDVTAFVKHMCYRHNACPTGYSSYEQWLSDYEKGLAGDEEALDRSQLAISNENFWHRTSDIIPAYDEVTTVPAHYRCVECGDEWLY